MVAARKQDPQTSRTAARISGSALEGVRYSVFKQLAQRPVSGYADHELVAALEGKVNRTPQRLRTARAELVKLGLVRPAGTTRKTENGYAADVYVIAS